MVQNQNRNQRGQKVPRARRQVTRRPKREEYANNQLRTQQTPSFSRRPQIEPPTHGMDMEFGAVNQPNLTPILLSQLARNYTPRLEYNVQTTENASPLFVPKTPISTFNTHIEQFSQEAPDHRSNLPSLGAAIEHLTERAHNIHDNAKGVIHPQDNNITPGAFRGRDEQGDSRSWVDTAVTIITQGYEDEVGHRKMIRVVQTFMDTMQMAQSILLARTPYQNAMRVVQAMIEQNASDPGGKAFVESEL